MARDVLQMDLNQGCVITRRPSALQIGEMTSGSGWRYNPGDNIQIHRDYGTVLHSTLNEFPHDMKYLAFEDDADVLVALRHSGDGDSSVATLSIATPTVEAAPINGLFWYPQWFFPQSLDSDRNLGKHLGVVHRGNQYFLGHGNNESVLLDGDPQDRASWKRMGMLGQEEAYMKAPLPVGFNSIDEDRVFTFTHLWSLMDVTVYGPQRIRPMADFFTVTSELITPDPDEAIPATLPEINRVYWFQYFFTEYDEANDVESVPYGAFLVGLYSGEGAFDTDPRRWLGEDLCEIIETSNVTLLTFRMPKFLFSQYYKEGVVDKRRNSRATHVRLYRRYMGDTDFYLQGQSSSRNDLDIFLEYLGLLGSGGARKLIKDTWTYFDARREAYPVGGLVVQHPLDGTDFVDHIYDYFNDPDGLAWEYHLGTAYIQRPPEPWDMGVLFGDSVVTNMVDNPSVLQYSRTGEPEYFPATNVLPVTSEGADYIVGIHHLNDVLAVLTKSGVHAVTFLPVTTDATKDALADISNEGCVGRRASTTVAMPQGKVVVWLSGTRLNLTSGDGAINACEDWSVKEAGLLDIEDAVLVNNRQAERVELFCNSTNGHVVYHFYYSRMHVKPGGFKMVGPHLPWYSDGTEIREQVHLAVVPGRASKQDMLWYATRYNRVYTGNQGFTTNDVGFQFGRLFHFGHPAKRLTIYRTILQHTPIIDDGAIEFYCDSKSIDAPQNPRVKAVFPGQGSEEIDFASQPVSGNYLQPGFLYQGTSGVSLGGLWFEMEVHDDGK